MLRLLKRFPGDSSLSWEILRSISNGSERAQRKMTTMNYAHSESYDYMQHSKVPTFKFQKSLPRLPIPLLEKTCERYLLATEPLLTAEEFKENQRIVEEFRSNQGAELNALLKLQDQANKHTSYISEPW